MTTWPATAGRPRTATWATAGRTNGMAAAPRVLTIGGPAAQPAQIWASQHAPAAIAAAPVTLSRRSQSRLPAASRPSPAVNVAAAAAGDIAA
ncbi:hypothetical protein ACTMTI_45940 [Nonomuraea sp. H19]|uniref:hypothetical protein n=1 Tax=Nonomuraea sp. H19 TaxID=3452206 RepID=UPI003F8B402B